MLWAVQDTGAQCKRERGVPAVSCMGKGVPCAAALRLGGLAQSRQADVVRLGIQHMKLQGEESAAPVVCMPVMQLATGFLLAELKWQEFARQLGEARKDFFFPSLPSSHQVFALLWNICAKPQEVPADENHPASTYCAEAGDRPEEARNKYDKEQVA